MEDRWTSQAREVRFTPRCTGHDQEADGADEHEIGCPHVLPLVTSGATDICPLTWPAS